MTAPDRPSVTPARARYSDAEKALGLSVCVLFAPDYDAASRTLAAAPGGYVVPAETLRAWHSKGRGVNPDALAEAGERAGDMAAVAKRAAEIALGCTVHLLEDAEAELTRMRTAGIRVPLAQSVPLAERLAKVAATAVDKHQLLTGGPTTREEARTMNLHAFLPPKSLHEVLTERARSGG